MPAYNKNHTKEECVGYLVKTDAFLVYFLADTAMIAKIEYLKALSIDYTSSLAMEFIT